MKRVFDLFLSIIGLLFLTPIFIFISLLVKLTDKGQVFYKQKRVGKNYKPFMLYKFRTMVTTDSLGDISFEPGNTPEITPVGKYLRKMKLDELPQLFNVLKGDMSIVGPRPEVEKWVAVYPEQWSKVLSVKPGITDNASILYRNEEMILASSDDPDKTYKEVILPAKLKCYEEYVKKNSLFGDLKLIFKTLFFIIFT